MKRESECQACGKSGCMSFYCFRLGVTIYPNGWYRGKQSSGDRPKRPGGTSTPNERVQEQFDFDEQVHRDPTAR